MGASFPADRQVRLVVRLRFAGPSPNHALPQLGPGWDAGRVPEFRFRDEWHRFTRDPIHQHLDPGSGAAAGPNGPQNPGILPWDRLRRLKYGVGFAAFDVIWNLAAAYCAGVLVV